MRLFRILLQTGLLFLFTTHLAACASGAPGRAKDHYDAPDRRSPSVTEGGVASSRVPAAASDPEAPVLARSGYIPPPDGAAQDAPAPSPVAGLIAEADRHVGAGRLDEAAGALERALRVEPGNPAVLQRLAVVRIRQQRYGQAEALAMRSNALSPGNHAVVARNWRIIAEARRLSGDARGAQQAMDQARRFELRSRMRDMPQE